MYTRSSNYLSHKGKKGMKWGYTDGEPNGKRTAGEDDELIIDEDTRVSIMDGKAYFSQPDGSWKSKDGDVYIEKKGKSLFSKKYKSTKGANLDTPRTTTVMEIGKLEQWANKAEKASNKFAKKTVKSLEKHVERGKKWLESLFD